MKLTMMPTAVNAGMFAIIVALGSCTGKSQQQPDQEKKEKTDVSFKKHTLTNEFISEGVAVGDVNHDGTMDVMAGAYWFEAPDWKRHEIFEGKAFDGAREYSNSFLNFSMDVNNDGWVDLIVIDFPGKPAYWYENPKNESGHWPKHPVHDGVDVGNESPAFVDIDGDNRKDLLCADTKEKQMVWLRAPDDGAGPWTRYPISEKKAPATDRFSHGLGYGDVNDDGINDVIVKHGWWEGPDDPKTPDWKFHPSALGEDCSQMHVLDVNGDGAHDVISASAHQYGIWWHEQIASAEGNNSWRLHEINRSFSQSHSSLLADIDQDGDPDLIVGKRFFAHNDTDNDPGAHDPAVLFWFEFTPGEEPFFQPRQIDDNSGSGLNIVAEDMTGDGRPDIAIANKKGVFVFERMAGDIAQ